MIDWFKHKPRAATPTPTPSARAARAFMMPLEPRIMFDAAVAVTVAEVLHADDSHAAAAVDAPASDAGTPAPAAAGTGSAAQGAADSPARHDIVFIDAGVRDLAELLGNIRADVEVHVVQNGLTEIAQILANRQDVDSVQIISHGQANAITLNGQVLHAESLAAYASELQTIGAALAPEGDILLYSCNTGATDAEHADFVSALAAATGKDVAASTDNSGSAQLGGNWVLERHTGTIEAGLFASGSAVSYGDLLAAPTSETFDGVTPSAGTTGATRVINGWTFSLLGANGSIDSGGVVNVTNDTEQSSLVNGGSDHAAEFLGTYASSGTGQAAAVLAATSGEEFSLQSIVVEQSLSDGNDYRLVGYRDGSAVSGATQDFTAGAYVVGGGTLVTVSGSAWQNLDAVRIVRQGGQTDIGIFVDDITVGAVVRPTATVVVADTALAAGETSLVTFTFSQAVTGFTNGDLTIGNGSLTTVTSGDGGVTWTATFTPTASFTSGTNAITLNMAGVSAVSTTATGTGTQNSNNYAIDTLRPTASIVVADNDLAVGETSGVTITFSEAVTGFTNADLTIANGTLSAVGSINGGITWTATLTPTASIADTTNVITLANTGVTDAAGNAGTGTTNSNNYAIDTARPTATIVVADNALSIGETSLVTITFSEAVSGFDNSALSVANGTLTDVSTSDDITFTATFTPTASVTDATNLITLDNTYVVDAAGNAGSGTTNSNNYAIDTVRPTASIVVADSNLLAGETSGVTITFSEAVTGFTNADLTIANGTLSTVGTSDGGVTWTATFTPTASLTDATNLITLANTGVTDAAGNAGTGTTDSNNYAIATVRPTASIVVADNDLAVGETSGVTITFSEAVTGFTNADLTIANGTLSTVGSINGGITWTATLTPTASITDATNVITLANTGVTNAAGNAGSGTTNSNNYAIDTARPTATIVVADNALSIGETSLVTITFSEAVTGFGNSALSVANGTLGTVSTSDDITFTATFTPTASVTDATNLITLDNTYVADAAGNAGSGTTDSNNYAIDTVRPTASIVVADSNLLAGETSLVTVTFSEAVTSFTNADLTIANGTLSTVSTSDGGVTWTATFTPTASITDATNLITLDNTGVTDAAGNAGSGTTDSNNYAIATVRPTASIVVADTALAVGETSLVTITFSEAVTGFTNADLTIANGTLSAVGTGDGGITWTATFTPTASLTDATNVITLANTGVTNAAGNTGSGTTDSNNYAIDTARPTASIVVADNALAVGETSLVTITFSEAVTGFTNADLTIANGTLSAVSSGDGGITWTATLTPTASLTDATNLITLDNTGVVDAASNAGSGTTDSNNYAIDTARPTASIVVADSALAIGETSLVTITFSEAVTGFANADLTIANGTLSAVSSGDGGVTWTATLTPTASVTDATNLITLDNTGVADAAGNAGSGTTDSNNYAIDTVRPTATVVVADTALSVGETSLVTITFSEAVTGFANADLSIANGTLSAVSSGDGGITWTATFTPTASLTDTTNLITLDNTGVTDIAGNAGSGTTDSNNYAIDTARPTASIVVTDTALAIGETSLVTITFSEAVTGFTNADLTIANGTLSAVSSGDGGITWTANFTPSASITDATNVITLDNTGVTDAAGNAGSGSTDSNNYAIDTVRPTASIVVADNALAVGETSLVTITFSEAVTGFTNADLTIANGTLSSVSSSDGGITWTATLTPTASITDATNLITLDNTGVTDAAGNAGTGTTDSNNYAIDSTRPTASIVVADTALAVGETSGVTITFSEAVTGFTNADLTIANGTLSTVSSSDGGITWTATLTPTASLTDTTNLITLDNTGVTDVAGNVGTGTTDSNNYAIDTARPTASIVVADTALAVGETSLVTITFSEAVTGFTNADLTIANGTLSAVSSGDGGLTWTATFTPTASVTDTTNLITLDNTGVTDAAGNAGSSTTDSNNYAIDTVRPTATVVVADNLLAIGETSLVTVTFSEAVSGFTNADLTVDNGTLSAVSSSDGGITWTATFTPTASVTDASNLTTLANTGVTDAAGNAGTGTTDSNNYAIDAIRPTASIVVADTALAIGETSLVTITFSEAVTGFTNADLTVDNGTLSAVSSSDGGITWTATFTPTASVSDVSNAITLDNTGVTDAAGNTGTGTTGSNNYAVDTARPTATVVVADTALAAGETSLVTITFSEAVTGFTNADLTVANGTLSAVSSSDGGVTWTATLTPTASLTDASNVITLANTSVTDAAGNAGAGTTDSNNYAIDSSRPTATVVVADTSLTAGESSLVTITFSEAVTGFTNADLTVANGTLSAVNSSDGGVTWTATLTPTAGISDTTNLITLANTGVTDVAGNAGTGSTDSNNYAINTTRPSASIAVADASLTVGETSVVTITFSEAVTGFTNADLTVANGTLSAVSSSDGGITWTATFTPTAGVTDATNLVTLNNTGVANAAGNTGSGTTDSNNYAIDTVRPTVAIVMADTALQAGDTSLVTFTFSEAVTGFTNADLTVANGTLSAVSSSDGGITWTATFTPAASVTDATNLITLANTGVADTAGNAGTGSTNSNNYTIDTARPLASITMADTALAIGETSAVAITFSEVVTGFTNADLTVANGTLSAVSSSDGGLTWTATFTPTTGVTATTNLITLANSGITDLAGNTGTGSANSANYAIDTVRPTATLTLADTALAAGETSLVTITFSEAVTGFTNADLTVANGTLSAVSSSDGGLTWTATLTPAFGTTDATNLILLADTGVTDLAGNAGSGSTVSANYAIDTARPSASIALADTALQAGDTSLVIITFSEAVTGFTNADLTVANGTLSAVSSSDGGINWTATFTPAAGVTAASNLITMANAGVTDAAGNTGTGTTTSDSYAIDTVRPLSSITVADTALSVGETTLVTITFSEPVTAFTNADLTVTNGTLGPVSSSDGGFTWTAIFTPTADITAASNVIRLANTSLTDLAGNAGTGTTDSDNIAIDTLRPTATLTVADTALGLGDTSAVTITFSEAVTGLTNADLTVANGTLSAVSSSDGGLTWTTTFTPTAGIASATAVVTLDNAGVQDAAGNTGTGSTASASIVVDTVAPTATGVVQADPSPTATNAVRYTVSFSEPVSGVGIEDFTLVKDPSVSGAIASVTQVDAQTYTVLISGVTGAGNLGLAFNTSGTGVADGVGNAVANGASGTAYDVRSASPPAPAAPPPAPPPPAPAPSPAAPTIPLIVLAPDASSQPGSPVNVAPPPAPSAAPPAPPVPSSSPEPTSGGFSGSGGNTASPPAPPPAPSPVTRSLSVGDAGTSPGAALRSVPDIGDFTVQAGSSVNFGLPPSTFTHADASARVTVEARQSNGQPLPAWLKFDPATGNFSGQPPPGLTQQLAIEVTARDERGRQATTHLDIKVQGAPAGTERPAAPPPQRPPGAHLRGLPIELIPDADAEDAPRSAIETAPLPGRAGLGAQFARHGLPARQAENAALLAHLRAAARPAA